MFYSFDLLGIQTKLAFFQHQMAVASQPRGGVEYVAAPACTLDAFIVKVDEIAPSRGWERERLVDTIVNFWLENPDAVTLWRDRLAEAGTENLLIARLGNLGSLQLEFERLLYGSGR